MTNQPERTKITTSHIINWKGHKAIINGFHELKFSKIHNMRFTVTMKLDGCYSNHVFSIGTKSKTKLKDILDELISDCEKDKREYAIRKTFQEVKDSAITTFDKISHPNFQYCRFQTNSYGNYYNIYWKDNTSPSGVSLVGGCSEEEWEEISKATGNSHNYLSPTEGRISIN